MQSSGIGRALLVLGWAGVAVLGLTNITHAGNIVVDPGFESSDPGAPPGTDYFSTGTSIDGGFWTVTSGTVGVDTDNFYVFDGDKSVFLTGSSGATTDALTQTLTTVPGTTYSVSFWANADTTNTFSLTFGGAAVSGAPTSIAVNGFPNAGPPPNNPNAALFTLYTGTAVATGTSTDLTFSSFALLGGPFDGVTVEIDDVSVSPLSVPEPSSFALIAISVLGCFSGYAVRRRSIV